LSFVALGLIATLVLGAAGPNKVASNPYLNIGFGILFVILAFAFFETFNFTLPSSMQSLAASWRRRGGVVGVLLMGLAFVFTAFTCTAPFIASILAAAASTSFSGDYARPLLGMALFALALSAPFFLIAFFPKLLTRLPKSGEWMSTMKAVLGFVELAYAILYFSKADLVLQAHIITRSVIFGLWASICICGALYLIGALKVNALAGGEAKIGAGRWLGAGIFALTAFYCFYAISGRPIDPNLAAFVPEAEYGAQSGSQSAPGDVVWLDDFDKAVALAKQENRPIFINFTGYTCTNCRWMEQNIFTKPPVRALFPKLVTVRLYTDGGIDADKNAALQIKLGKANAQPLYALVTPDGVVLDTHIGIEKDPAAFARFIDEAFRAPTSSVSAAPSANDEWASYSDERYAEALKAGKPIVIDFTASWCIVCHSIERTVFSQPDVRGQLGKFTTLKADLTTFDSPESVKIEKKFGVAKLPTVVILNPSGKEFAKSRVTGILSAKDFLAHLNSASTNQRARWTLIALR
jgi:thiol:disulfide interchange protein DsbD